MIKRLWEQQKGFCAITGELLIPGSTASLDHIVPRDKGGLTVEGNLQWVLYDVNIAKAALHHDEFVALCRKVVEHATKLETRKVN